MDLKKIWKNRKEIYEGIKNSVMRDDLVEDVAAKRMAMCNECPSKGDKCEVPGTGFVRRSTDSKRYVLRDVRARAGKKGQFAYTNTAPDEVVGKPDARERAGNTGMMS